MSRVPGVFEFALDVAREAGHVIRDNFHGTKTAQEKESRADLVTETDVKVEKLVMERIRAKFPDHKFIGEETTSGGEKCCLTDAPTWIIDPVDGTSNFFKAFPYCCISIGYCENQRPVVGVIYNPIKEELYAAQEGKGATLNGKPLHVSKFLGTEKILLLTDLGSDRRQEIIDTKAANMVRVIHKVLAIRSFGSAAIGMAAVGSGIADAYFEFGIHCWDMAAGVVIVREAGGVAVNCDGSPLNMMARNVFVANSQAVIDAISPELTHVDFPHD